MVVPMTQGDVPNQLLVLRILIVEADSSERALLREYLYGDNLPFFTPQVWDVPDLATALSMREQQAVDVQRLATMGAGAQDVVRLHIRMLKETGSWTTPTGERAFGVDAHLALVEWLGTLADLYRDASIHARGNP